MKNKMTFKAMKNSAKVVVAIGYCDAQHLLKYEDAVGYAATESGWACDLYRLGYNRCIVTGYQTSRAKTDNLNKAQRQELLELDAKCREEQWSKEKRREEIVGFLDKHFPM